MADTILINTLVEGGVNTQSRLLKVSCDTGGSVPIPHTLRHHPVWAQVIQAKETITGLPVAVGVNPQITETPAAPNGTSLAYSTGGNPTIGTGTLYVYLCPPRPGETEIIHFTLHLGRTHSRAR